MLASTVSLQHVPRPSSVSICVPNPSSLFCASSYAVLRLCAAVSSSCFPSPVHQRLSQDTCPMLDATMSSDVCLLCTRARCPPLYTTGSRAPPQNICPLSRVRSMAQQGMSDASTRYTCDKYWMYGEWMGQTSFNLLNHDLVKPFYWNWRWIHPNVQKSHQSG